MAGKTVTRDDLYEAVRQHVGLSAHECKVLVEQVIGSDHRLLSRRRAGQAVGIRSVLCAP
jgi:hypothetical protein